MFAVETVRSLIDRDIVQPIDGVYRLVGDVGELAVPGSLHALLAARLDALDSGMRRLVADAAVLGTTFPAEALIAVSGQQETTVRAALDELVRREVFSVSADPLSPERGSYQFTQNMLRQVAYATLSRRDRKARHLTVAAHLRTAFPGDGEEVAEVIARHYLDALKAVPEAPDAGQIRRQAVGALIQAAERAERTGATAQAAGNYATAAELTQASTTNADEIVDGSLDAGELRERAAQAAAANADWATAIGHAGQAREYHLQHGRTRAAARAQTIAGDALRLSGRHSEAREQLTDAVEILRSEPDANTVRALGHLAALEALAGSPDADRLTLDALILGQAIGVGTGELIDLFTDRGIYLSSAERRPEAVAYFGEAARLATQAADNKRLGRALLNLADDLMVTDAVAAAGAARTAAEHLRRAGERYALSLAITNLVQALLLVGEWDAAEAELAQAADFDGLDNSEDIACYRGWLAALRGDAAAAQATLASLSNMRASDDPQDKSLIDIAEAFTAAARRQPQDALRDAHHALTHADAIGIGFESLRWAWPLAARVAHDLGDSDTTGELLSLLDDCPPGHLAPMLRAERDLVRARLAASDGEQAAAASFAAAVSSLREYSTPYHLAHGLLDHAQYLTRLYGSQAAEAAVSEARDIAGHLHCQPLLDRAENLTPAKPPVQA